MPLRTIRVTTREELAAALQTADRVVVEGDDALLSYAIGEASGDLGHRIDVELASPLAPAPAFMAPPLGGSAMPPAPSSPPAPAASAMPRPAAPSPAPQPRRGFVWIFVVVLVLGMSAALATFTHFAQDKQAAVAPARDSRPSQQFSPSAGAPAPPRAVAPRPPSTSPSTDPPQTVVSPKSAAPPADNVELVQAIAWPAVAIIAIIALALIARQAIANGRNVEFSWKVTEKVSGRVVITKVKDPQPRRGRVAAA